MYLLDVGHLLPKVLYVSLLNPSDFNRHHILLSFNLNQLFLHELEMLNIRKIRLRGLMKHLWSYDLDGRLQNGLNYGSRLLKMLTNV